MRLSTSLALAALGLAASALPAAAGTLLVPQQFPTIQKALNAAKPYDTVLVSAKANGGVYGEAITISTPHVVLQGAGNPVIDGSNLGKLFVPKETIFSSYFIFPNGIEISANHVAVRGMTIQGFGYNDGALSPDAAAINVGTFVSTGDFTGGEVSFSDVEISGNTLRKNSTGLTIQGYTGDIFQPTYLKGYRVLGNLITGNTSGGALLSGASVLVSGNRFTGNKDNGYGRGGLEVTGTGITVSGNEAGGNGGSGLKVTDYFGTYDPSVNDPKNPNPDPTVVAGNSTHDNAYDGIDVSGTEAVFGNSVANNGFEGIYLIAADYSAVTGNLITGSGSDGVYVDYTNAYGAQDSGIKISFNQVSGSGYDGIYFYQVGGGLISYNNVSGSRNIGIHLSDYTADGGNYDYAPTLVTQNRALHNTLFDAKDDASAPDADNAKTINVWTRNLFGTTDPVGLSK